MGLWSLLPGRDGDHALRCNVESYSPLALATYFDHLVGFELISALNLLRIAWPNELKFSATITKAPGPPITLVR